MRKILAYIITITLLAGLFSLPVAVMAEENTAYSEPDIAEQTLLGFGVFDKEIYNSDALLSRADFAEIISSLCNFVPENKNYLENMDIIFGQDKKDELITTSEEQIFDDVDNTMEAFEAINAVYRMGYMKGITPTHFAPHYDITAGEVVKVIISMLGRDRLASYKGGYPNGYMEVARSLKLLNGISVASSDFITLRETANLIYNAFDINVYEISGIDGDGAEVYTESEETFLTYCASLYKAEGEMTDNGISTYYGASKVGQDMVVVGGVSMYIGSADYMRGYLGRNITAYYAKDVSGKKYLIYATLTGEDKAKTFSADSFAGYTSSAMKYYDEKGKLNTLNLASSLKVIYNNNTLTRFNADTFDFLFGDITLVSTSGSSKYDVIIVNDYMVGKINKIVSSDKKVYSETNYASMGAIKSLNLEADNGKIVIITDENGNTLDFEALSRGNVISVAKSKDGSYISVKVCSSQVNAFELVNYSIGDNLEITNGEQTYVLKGISSLTDSLNLKTGELYDLYFDYEGNLIWMENLLDSTDLKKAFLIDAGKNETGLDSTSAIKLYTADSELVVYELDKKVIINHKSVESDKAISEIINSKGKIVLYRADKETGILKAIVTPLEFGADDKDGRGWYEVNPYVVLSAEGKSTEEQNAYKDYLENDFVGTKYSYQSNGGYLNKAMVYDKKATTLFAVPSTKDEYDNEKKFYINKVTFQNNSSYYINAYDSDQNAIMPSVMAFAVGGGSASGDAVSQRYVFVVSKVTNIVDSEGEQTKAYRGYIMDFDKKSATETTLPVSTEVEFVDGSNKSGAAVVDIAPGDIIRYATNSDGEISAIFVSYDMSKKTAYPFGTPSLQWYDNDTYAGYPYITDGNYVKLTAVEPHEVEDAAYQNWIDSGYSESDYNAALAEHKYFASRENSIFHVLTKVILVVEEGARGEIAIRTGTADDVVSYEESGELSSGEYDIIVGTETSWGHTIGTVIYK